METQKNSSEIKRQFIFQNGELYKDELGDVLMSNNLEGYEAEKFDKLKSKLLRLVEKMDEIKEKMDKLNDLGVEFLYEDCGLFSEIYNKGFKNREEDKFNYHDFYERLYKYDKKLDEALKAYNNRDKK